MAEIKEKEFISVFQINKLVLFEVEYYTLSTNPTPLFTTSANQFCRNKRDYTRCGQAQRELLPKFSKAFKFWEKWDKHHLHPLTDEQIKELLQDIEELKERYNFIIKELDTTKRPYSPLFPFWQMVEFSKQTPKRWGKQQSKQDNIEILTAKNQYNYTTKQIIINHEAKTFKICVQDGKIAKKNSTKKAIDRRALELLAIGYKQEGGNNEQ